MRLKGFIYAIISAIFFGSSGIFVKRGSSDIFSPVDLLILQYIIASVILFVMCLVKYKNKLKLSKEMLKKLLIQGVVGNTLMTVFFYLSFKYLDIAITTMLLYTYPIMVALASVLIFKEKLSRNKLLAITGTFLGCLLVLNIFSQNYEISVTGILFALLSAIFYAFMNIYAEGIVEDIPGLVITFYTTLFSLVVLLIFDFRFIDKLSDISLYSIQNASLLAFFCEIIPLTLLYEAIKYIGPISTSIISTLEIPASALAGFLVLNEPMGFIQILGILIIVYCIIKLKSERSEGKEQV